jgi:hypothetical protein
MRFFDLDVTWNATAGRLEGKVRPLYTQVGADFQRNRAGFFVQGFFSDLRQHDMGEGFKEIDFGGTINTIWRTPMLWGVGSGFPWGHDGRSLTLEDAILRHGGAAQASKQAWLALPADLRARGLSFLNKLVLYDIETLPTDLDGDQQISSNYFVAGMDTGPERFNPEWLFRVPLQIQGQVNNIQGLPITSFAGMNIDAAYGRNLPLRLDSDGDTWPDVWDHAPLAPGFKDGVQN